MEYFWLLVISFFVISIVYASVGFGGGSSYLAIMAVLNVAIDILRPVALLCNIIVVTGGVVLFARNGQLDLRRSFPFLLASIPCAFLGGYIRLDDSTFLTALGISLIAAAAFLWIEPGTPTRNPTPGTTINVAAGGAIGFLSGLVSIGGGIFLSPLLHLINWDNGRKIAAMASLFILGNSISGLAGQWIQIGAIPWDFAVPLMVAVFAGGQIGSRLAAAKLNLRIIRRTTAILVMLAGINILRNTML